MNIIKTREKNWQVRQMVNGKKYCVTVAGKKPTIEQAIKLIQKLVEEDKRPEPTSFVSCAEKYIKSRENTVSPATVREYTRMVKRIPEWFTEKNIYEISSVDMQRLVNEYSVGHKAKSTHDLHGFCVAVIRFFKPDTVFNTRFKQNDATEPYIPTKEEIDTLIRRSEGTIYHIPLQLARYSLRRSEICAVEKTDLTEDNLLCVSKALVQNVNKEWVIKRPKTESSVRYVPIDDELAEEIRNLEEDRIYPYAPQNISNYLRREQDKLGMNRFSVHKLRHAFASELHGKVDEKTIEQIGGWKNSTVLKKIYTHSDYLRNEEKRNEVINILKEQK